MGFYVLGFFPYHLGWPQIAKDRKKSNCLPDILWNPQQKRLKVEDFLSQLLNIKIRKGLGTREVSKGKGQGPQDSA